MLLLLAPGTFVAVADNYVYVGSDNGHLYCINASNGKHVWRYITDGIVQSSPAVFDS